MPTSISQERREITRLAQDGAITISSFRTGIAAVVSALVVLYNLGAAIFDSDLKAYAAIDRIPIGIASFLSSVVLIGFAYIVKHVCEAKD